MGYIMKCVKCGKESEYDAPEYFCEEHWAEWWASGMVDNPLEVEREKEEALKAMRYSDSIMRSNNPNVFGEHIRSLAFEQKDEYDLGCYSTFELGIGFNDIDPTSDFGKKVLDVLLNSYCGNVVPTQKDIDFVLKSGRMATDGALVVAWYWADNGTLLVGCRGRYVINDDCKQDHKWRWVR